MNFETLSTGVGRNIRDWRKQRKVSFVTLAQKARIGKGTLSQIENGGNPCLSTLVKICNVLRITLDELLLQ